MDKSIFLRDCETKKEIQYFYASAVVECAAISADGRYLLSGTVGAGTQLWEVSSGRELRKFTVGGFVSSVCFSPRSSLIAIGTSDGEVCIFDRLDGRLVTAARVARNGVGQMVETVKFTRDGAYLLTASPTQLQLWQSASGRESSRVEIGVVGVTSADLSPTGGSIVTGHSDSSVRLWSVTQGTELHVYHGHTETVKAVAYAPDGQSVASGGFDKTVRIWRVRRDAQA
jgi:WD40 repeat protein